VCLRVRRAAKRRRTPGFGRREARDHLVDEPGLADARLAGDEHDLPPAVRGPPMTLGQERELRLAPDEGRAGRAGRARGQLAAHGHRTAVGGLEDHHVADGARRDRAEQDGAGGRLRAEARRGRTDAAAHAVDAHVADDDRHPGLDGDAHGHGAAGRRAGDLRDRVAQLERSAHRPGRVVLAHAPDPEPREHLVARGGADVAAQPLDDLGHPAPRAPDELVELLVVHRAGERVAVGEAQRDHGHAPALALLGDDRRGGRSRLASWDRLRGRLDRRGAFVRGVLQEKRRVMPEDPLLERSERRGRHEPELLVEGPAEVLQRRQRVRVPPAAIQREHQLRPRALTERLAGDERLELWRHGCVLPEGQLGVDAILDAVEAQLRQARRLEHGERLAELRERLAAPQGERFAEQASGRARVARGERAAPGVPQPLESGEIDRLGGDDERVAARTRDEHVRGQSLAQLRDVDLHHLRRGLRRVLPPEILDQALRGNGAVGVEGEAGEQRAGSAAAELHRCACIAHLERTEEERQHGDGARCYARARVRRGGPATPRAGR